ncbi:unnamed protein product [Urochloa humidicola]
MVGDGSIVDWESLAEATSGAIGSLVSTTVIYSLDTCKTKFQAELQMHNGVHKYSMTAWISQEWPMMIPWSMMPTSPSTASS